MQRGLLFMIALVLASGCGSSGRVGSQRSAASQNVITADEIQAQHFRNAHELIQALRPFWLRSRSPSVGASGRAGVIVYLDNNRLGDARQLTQIAVGHIEWARFLPAAEATTRFGTNHADGAIIITTKQQ